VFFLFFHRQNHRKRSHVDAKTHEREGLNSGEYIICWGGLTDRITYGGVVIVLHLYLLEQCLMLILGTSIKTCNFVTFYKFLIHLGMHHTSRGNGDINSSGEATKTTSATAMVVEGNTTIN
jgi:hypothetical protein